MNMIYLLKRNLKITLVLAVLLGTAPGIAAEPDPPSQEWVLVDGIAAIVENDPVLWSDIALEEDFGLLRTPGEGGKFPELLNLYINRLLILKEREDIGGFRLEEEQAEGAFAEYLENLGGQEAFNTKLETWGVGEEEVVGRFKQALLASLYAESRIRFLVKVLPSDIEKAYEEDPGRWGNVGVFEAWDDIRDELVQKSFAQEKERWLKSLRNRYRLKMFFPEEEAEP